MQNAHKPVLFLIALTLFVSCAQQVPPKGGERDELPPRIVESEPQNEAINFEGNSIRLEFDEFVRVEQLLKEMIVTPPLENLPEVKMKGKKVQITWEDTLLENTTYLFQFGDGIVDVNESNPLDSNVFVFSTGPYLDSFEMRAKVIDAFTMKPVENVWVLLYADTIDSLPYLELPRYFGKTDAAGEAHIRYLAPGSYKVFALEAANGGYLYDQPEERIAFLLDRRNAVNPADTNEAEPIELYLFKEPDTLQYLADFSQIGNKGISLFFNRTVDTLVITELSGKDINEWTPVWNVYSDSVTYWFPSPDEYDSLKLEVIAGDFKDTIFLRKPRASRGKKGDSHDGVLTLQTSKNKQPYFKPLRLQAQTPLAYSELSRSLLIGEGDSLPLEPLASIEGFELKITHKWKQDGRYTIFIPDSSLCDQFRACNDTLKYSFTTTKKEDYGDLTISFDLPNNGHPYIWQLLKGDKVYREDIVESMGKLSYELIPAGTYRLKIMHDVNANGQWDSGFYLKNIQPEGVSFYGQDIVVRSNWESEIDWTLTPTESN